MDMASPSSAPSPSPSRPRGKRPYLLAFIVLFAVIFALAVILARTGDSTEVKGVMTAIAPVRGGDRLYLEVSLDDGRQVSVLLPPGVAPSSGGRVTLMETTNRLFKSRRYSFLHFGG